MKKVLFSIIVIMVFFCGLLYLWSARKVVAPVVNAPQKTEKELDSNSTIVSQVQKPAPNVVVTKDTTTTSSSSTTTPKQTFTLADVAQHASRNSCWMVIEGGVFDVTTYISSHPGRDKILIGCGKDATDIFYGAMGGKKHSPRAESILSDFYIGTILQ